MNLVENVSTKTNPSYGSTESWAAGIYIDGGRNILVKDNTVRNAPWAFEVGAENCVNCNKVTLTGNTASESYYGDLLVGGYSARGYRRYKQINCNPRTSSDENEGHGYVSNVYVVNNSFDTTNGEEENILLQCRVKRGTIIGETFDNGTPSFCNGNGDENSVSTF